MDANLQASILCAWALLWMSLLLGAASHRPIRRSGLRAWQQARNDYRRLKSWNRRHLTYLVKVSCSLLYRLLLLIRKRNEAPTFLTRLFANALWHSVSFCWLLGISMLWGDWHLRVSTFFYWLIATGLNSEFLYRRSMRQQRAGIEAEGETLMEMPRTESCAEDRITGDNPPGM